MRPLVLAPPQEHQRAELLARALDADVGVVTVRRFPDGETYLRVHTDPRGRHVVVLRSLDHPDCKIIPLFLLLETARDLGAASVGLVAPYLCYMRQDRRFQPGEAVSARLFPDLLGRSFDWLVTVDPHLHRIHDLDDVYVAPTRVVHAAAAIADWVQEHVDQPLFIGPDSESEQWVCDVAERAGAPFVVLDKVRHGDREVEVSVPDVDRWRAHTPVLVDDIISTGRTMVATLGHLSTAGLPPAVCIGVHALFAGDACEVLCEAGAARVVTADTVAHHTNHITLVPDLAAAVRELVPGAIP